ncbi:MAG: DUF4253 domain-containing protein [Catenulispora sp.]|nr:DUF4253 domain-containing protein [Catenulispora sp.]
MATDDLAERLSRAGVAVPELVSLSSAVGADVAGVDVVGFVSEGDEAVAWWRRLRAVHDRTGRWPVLVPPGEELAGVVDAAEQAAARRVTQAAALDGEALLIRPGTEFDALDDDARRDLLARWPDEPGRRHGLVMPYQRDGSPAPLQVALIEAQSWQIPALVGYGGWNGCPEPAVHGAVLRHWGRRYGAELACMSSVGLELVLTRPPATRWEALRLAWEYPAYCLDGMDLYDAEDIPDLAACLLGAEAVRFWWD